jgi:hypothetical protein
MRTALCTQCLSFIEAEKRDLLTAARDDAIENLDTHRIPELMFLDVEATARRLIHDALGAKARP